MLALTAKIKVTIHFIPNMIFIDIFGAYLSPNQLLVSCKELPLNS